MSNRYAKVTNRYAKVTISKVAKSSTMWYEDLIGHTFYVTKNPSLEYYGLASQKKIIFKTDTI